MAEEIKYINATALSKKIRESNDAPLMKLYADSLLAAAPAVPLVLPRRGMWLTEVNKVYADAGGYCLSERVLCSECKQVPTGRARTTCCDHCGARMDIFSLDELDAYHASVSAYNS